jgi:hypothetical protein
MSPDTRLRRFGFKVMARPAKGPALWWDGWARKTVTEDEATRLAAARERHAEAIKDK